MTTELTECPNCGLKLKSGLLSSVYLLSNNQTQIINEYNEKKSKSYCNKCGNDLFKTYCQQIISELNELINEMQNLIEEIPIISTHTPLNWDYDILQIVTGQSTTGNGAMTEMVASFTNIFGGQSGQYNSKLKEGENICFSQLRKQTLDFGGNAVIATHVNYAEIGGNIGMLMVCMSGTAIRLKNISLLGIEKEKNIEEVKKTYDRIMLLSTYNTNENN